MPDIRRAVLSGQEEIPAKAIARDAVIDLTLYLKDLNSRDRAILAHGCLMNDYAAGKENRP